MDTALARTLAATFEKASLAADETVAKSLEALGIAELFSDVPGDLVFLGEDLRRAGVIIDQQVDLLEGFELDLDAFADALGTDPRLLEQQLAAIEELGLGSSGIIPLLQWDADFVVPTDLRDVFVGLPEPGVDPALDAAIERLNDFLLPLLLESELRQVNLTEAQEADLRILGDVLGADLETLEITVQVWSSNNKEYQDETRVVSYLQAGGSELLRWIYDAFQEDQALARLGATPSLTELIVVWYERALAAQKLRILEARDDDGKDRYSGPRLPPLDFFLAEAAKLESLDSFLVDVLLGRAPLPADPEALGDLVAFASLLGYDVSGGDHAITVLREQRFLQEVVVLGDPTDGEVLFSDEFIEGTVAFGIRSGAITQEIFNDAAALADYVITLIADDPTRLELDDAALDLDPGLLVQAILARVPTGFFTENQLLAAITYIQAGATVGEQRERLAHTLLAFHTSNSAGVPTFTNRQWNTILGPAISDELGYRFQVSQDSEAFRFITEHFGVPGYHKLKSGRTRYHLGIDENGVAGDFIIERIKKRSWFGLAFGIVINVAALFVPGGGVVAAAYNARLAADAGDDLGLLIAAFGALGSFASAANLSGLATFANTTQAGLRAYQAFDDGDLLEGIGYSLVALGHGAELFDASEETVDTINAAADIVVGSDSIDDGLRDGDLGGVVGGAFQAGGGIIAGLDAQTRLPLAEQRRLTALTGKPAELRTLERVANTLDDLAAVATPAVGVVDAIEAEDPLRAIANSLFAVSAGAVALTNADGYLRPALDPSTGTLIELRELADFSRAGGLVVDGLAAAEDGDYFGLLARLGEAATIVANDPTSLTNQSAEQLRRIAAVADILVNLDPDTTDPALVGQLLASELRGLIDAFTPPDVATPDVAAEAALLAAEAAAIEAAGTPVPPIPEPRPIQSEPSDEPQGSVLVTTGDTLSQIAVDNGVSVDDLLAANPDITDPDSIRAGDVIAIPDVFTDGPADDSDTSTAVLGTTQVSPSTPDEPGITTDAGAYDAIRDTLNLASGAIATLEPGAVILIDLITGETSSSLGIDGSSDVVGSGKVTPSATIQKDAAGVVTIEIETTGSSHQGKGPLSGTIEVDAGFTVQITPPPGEQFTSFPDLLDPLGSEFPEGTTLTIRPSTSVTGTLTARLAGAEFAEGGASLGVFGSVGDTTLSSITVTRADGLVTVTESYGDRLRGSVGVNGEISGGGTAADRLVTFKGGLSLSRAEADSVSVVSTLDEAEFDQSGYLDRLVGVRGPDSVAERTASGDAGGGASLTASIGPVQFGVETTWSFGSWEVSLSESTTGEQLSFSQDRNGIEIDGSAAGDGSDPTIEVTVDGRTITLDQADLDAMDAWARDEDTTQDLTDVLAHRLPADVLDNRFIRDSWATHLGATQFELDGLGIYAEANDFAFPGAATP